MSDSVFPQPENWGNDVIVNLGGLSKRELFAAMAMQGCLAAHDDVFEPSTLAKDAVEYADALIKELAKESK